MMTNKEHDDLWKNAFYSIPYLRYLKTISDSLRRANAIAITKELHELGIYSDETYAEGLSEILDSENFERESTEEIIKKVKDAKDTKISGESYKKYGYVDTDTDIPWYELTHGLFKSNQNNDDIKHLLNAVYGRNSGTTQTTTKPSGGEKTTTK